MRAVLIVLAAWAAFACGAAAQPQTPDPARMRAGFAQLALDFCADYVTGEAPIETVVAATPGLRLGRTQPLRALEGAMRDNLRTALRAQDDTPIVMVALNETAVGNFVVAFARADHESCIVLAQDIADIQAEVRRRLDAADSAWALNDESGGVRTYARGHGSDRAGAALYIGAAESAESSAMDRVLVGRIQGLAPRLPANARTAWADALVAACLSGVFENRALAAADFAPRWTANGATASGSPRLIAAEGQPNGTLILNSLEGRGCIFLGAVGQVRDMEAAVLAAIRARNGQATETPRSIPAPKFNIPNPAGGAPALAVVDTRSGSLMVIIRTQMR